MSRFDHASAVQHALLAGGGGQVSDGSQELVRLYIVADLARSDRRVEQRLKGRLEVLPEVPRQGVESGVPGVQGRRETSLGSDEAGEPPKPARERLAGLVLARQRWSGSGARVDFSPEDGCDKVGALRKVTVQGRDAHARPRCDLAHGRVHTGCAEDGLRGLEQRVEAALGVGSHSTHRRRGWLVGPLFFRRRLHVVSA